MDWVKATNTVNKLRDTAYHARNQKFQDMWYAKADAVEHKYLSAYIDRVYSVNGSCND